MGIWRGGRFRAQHGVDQLRWRKRLRKIRGYTGWLETRYSRVVVAAAVKEVLDAAQAMGVGS